jgi:DNA helicase-2/ATP-dependent DNA helicase PcrA
MNFDTEFNKLTAAQKTAVEEIFGPVLVAAGPGTGKTQVLALRVGNILQKTDTPPSSILALTFTDAAAENMRQRLLKLVGPTAFEIPIFTFHGFCHEIIRKFGEHFFEQKNWSAVDELQILKLLREILQRGDFPNLNPAHVPEIFLREISGAISNLKKENFTAKKFAELIENLENPDEKKLQKWREL